MGFFLNEKACHIQVTEHRYKRNVLVNVINEHARDRYVLLHLDTTCTFLLCICVATTVKKHRERTNFK